MTTDGRIQVMFPPEFLELQQELQHHPDLCTLLDAQPTNELEIRLAEIAAYCGIILNGQYDGTDLKNVARICTKKLIEGRTGIVIIGGEVQ